MLLIQYPPIGLSEHYSHVVTIRGLQHCQGLELLKIVYCICFDSSFIDFVRVLRCRQIGYVDGLELVAERR